MAGRKKLTRTPPKDAVILDEAMVVKLSRGVAALLGPPAVELAHGLGVHLDDVLRFLAVKSRCVAAREKAGLTLQDVAEQLRVPQYRIRDIESGHLNRITPTLLREYIELLGLTVWYAKWSMRANQRAMVAIKSRVGKEVGGRYQRISKYISIQW